MQLKKRIVFHWNRWMIFLFVFIGMGIIYSIIAEEIEVKAADWVEENKLTSEYDLTETLYYITYYPNGGSGEMPISELSDAGGNLAPNCFERTGYTFTGWAVSENGDRMYRDEALFYPTKDMALYAVWEINKYMVSLEEVGEDASGASSAVSYDSLVSVSAGTKEGYTFAGWIVKSGGVVLADASKAALSFSMPDEDVCLCANWTINSYQIVLEEGGEGNSGSGTAQYQSTVTIQSGVKEGYTFDGWIVEAGEVVLADASASTTTFVVGTSDVKIKALWKADSYMVTVIDGGEGSADSQNISFGETVTVDAGSKNGFYFCGWEIVEGSISLENNLDKEIYFSMPASDVVLQAIWKEIVEVKADLNHIFYNTYNSADFYKDGCYNIGQKISIEKDMLDVVIGFFDGSSVLAKNQDYKLGNHCIDRLGENRIEVVLTEGKAGLSCYITLIGYSSELDTLIKDLGLSEGDYSGLAAKVEQMQTEIRRLGMEIAKYEENLMAIKELLAEVGIDTDLAKELEERLKNVQDSVKETVNQLKQAEEEFDKIKQVVSEIFSILGTESDEWEAYENLSDILKKLKEEIEENKKNEETVIKEINQIAEKLGIEEKISSTDDSNRDIFFEKIEEKIDEIKKQLELYQKTMDQLKDTFEIANTGSLESQLNEVLNKIELKLTYLEDLKNEIERQLEGEYGEVDTEGMQQIEAIFVKIRALKDYADGLKQFYYSLQKLLGFDSSSTKEEIYQSIANIKDKVTEYDQFLNQTEALVFPNGVNGSSGLVTGEQTKEELNKVYVKIEDIVRELDILKEMFQVLLEKEEIPTEDKEEFLSLIEQIKRQKEMADHFINHLKELLEMDAQASEQEIYNKVSAIKDTMAEYWLYLSKVEHLIQMEDGSHIASGAAIVTGPAVTERLAEIYYKLTDMVEQQTAMSETIKQMIEKEKISKETIQELQEIQQEMMQQKQQADLFLEELKKLLELKDSAGYKEVIDTITDMKGQLKYCIVVIEKLMQQLGMVPEEEQGNVSEQLKVVLNKVLELMQQLEEQIKKSEEKEQTIILLEQKVNGLSVEKQESEAENKKLKEEIEKLKQELDSSETPDWDTLDRLERKTRLQQETITELEKQLQIQAKEMEGLFEERKQLLEDLSNRDRQIKEQKEQIEVFEKQLVEKEERIKELETILQAQAPIQDLLEKNQIHYEQLVTILSNKDNIESNRKVQEKKETTVKKNSQLEDTTTVEEPISEEAIVQKEKREDLKTAIAESEELSLEETEEEIHTKESFETETEQEEQSEEKEEHQKEDRIHWGILLVIMILLVLIGSAIFTLCGRDKIEK